MDKMWGDKSVKDGVEGSARAALFRDGTRERLERLQNGLFS